MSASSPVNPSTRNLAHVSPHYTPWTRVLTSPHTRVSICAIDECPVHLHRQTRPKRDDGDIGSDSRYAQFFRFMRSKADDSRPMRFQILHLGAKLSIWSGEEKLVADQGVEGRNVGAELCYAKCRLEIDELGVDGSHRDAFHHGTLGTRHGDTQPSALTAATRCWPDRYPEAHGAGLLLPNARPCAPERGRRTAGPGSTFPPGAAPYRAIRRYT